MSTQFMPILGGFAGFLRRFFDKRFTVDVQAQRPEIGTQNGTVMLIFQPDGSVFSYSAYFFGH